MLPKKNRLQKKKDIDEIFRKGETRKSGLFIVKIKNNSFEDWRFCFIVSRKVSKKASVRNRIRRRLRGFVNDSLKTLASAKTGKDILIIVRPGAEKESLQEIGKALSGIFK